MTFLWAIVRPFMKRKLTERIHFLGKDWSKLHAIVDPKDLPPAFEGTLEISHSWFIDSDKRGRW